MAASGGTCETCAAILSESEAAQRFLLQQVAALTQENKRLNDRLRGRATPPTSIGTEQAQSRRMSPLRPAAHAAITAANNCNMGHLSPLRARPSDFVVTTPFRPKRSASGRALMSPAVGD